MYGQVILAYSVPEFCGSIVREVVKVPDNGAAVTSFQLSPPLVLLKIRLSQAGGGVLPLGSHRVAAAYKALGFCGSIISALIGFPVAASGRPEFTAFQLSPPLELLKTMPQPVSAYNVPGL